MKVPHIVCHELLLINFPLLAVAEVVCWATLIPIGQRALQRGDGESRGARRVGEGWIELRKEQRGGVHGGTKRRRRKEGERREEEGVRAERKEEGDNEVRGTA